ncbi:MAG: SH3 domain-containing protein, partial [Anaerolineales bacterium]|nr:SH3 domain-containing protein [Anaerolineales bacterium]
NPFTPPTQPTVEIIPTVTPALPTLAPFPTATPTPKPTPTPSVPTEIGVGGYVKVVGAEAEELSYRTGPGLNFARLKLVKDGVILKVLDGPEEADGLTWWRLEDEEGDIGWAADKWLKPTLP